MENTEVRAKMGLMYFKKILFFAVPLIATGVLQSLYNAADLVVVGRFEGELALAAVGSTGSLTNLILGLFMGLSVGAGVCVAHAVGAKQDEDVRKVLHTSVLVSIILGVLVAVIGFVLAPQLLHLMDTPDDVISAASLYVRIIFLGAPASILYNYCAAMLRASGDSKRPLAFLTISGLVNVALNIVLVAVFHWGVAGVAVATSFSQLVSAVLIIRHLAKQKGALRLSFSKLRIYGDKLKMILLIGIPSGIQGSLFSFSNVMVQSSINSFGSTVMAGSSAASNIEAFYYAASHAFYDCALTFVGQSVGARKFKRIKKIVFASILNAILVSGVLVVIGILFKDMLIGFYIPNNPEAVAAAGERFVITALFQFICAFMEIASGTLRGMGKSVTSAVISLVFACLFRILWLETAFKLFTTPSCIYLTYPLSWALTSIVGFIFVHFAVKKLTFFEKKVSKEAS